MRGTKRTGAGAGAPPRGELPLERLPIAAGLSAEELAVLAGVLEREMLNATEVLYREGDPGGRLYLLVSGKLSIAIRGAGASRTVMTYVPGAMLGETSLLEGTPHAATATAGADSVVYSLSRAALDELAVGHPTLAAKLLLNLGRHLSGRLRRAPEDLRKLSDS